MMLFIVIVHISDLPRECGGEIAYTGFDVDGVDV